MENKGDFEIIKRVVDTYFSFMDEMDGNHFIAEFVPLEMAEISKPPRFEGTIKWQAIPSTVTNAEFEKLESFVNIKLPKSYKYFIQYRNFIELYLGEYPVVFFKNLPNNWLKTLKERMEFYPRDFLCRKLIPIADYSDYGVICFNAKYTGIEENEYTLVWLDHEDGYEQEYPLAKNFIHLFELCEPHLNEWIKDVRDEYTKSV